MHWQELLTNLGAVGALLCGALAWIFSKVNKKFTEFDKKMQKMHIQLSVLKVQVVKLKTKEEQRTLRVIHMNKNGEENTHFNKPQVNKDK
jgi:16S rRNA G527 N7-methylase RsmG